MRTSRLLENFFIILVVIGVMLFVTGMMGSYGFRPYRVGDWFLIGTFPVGSIGLAIAGMWRRKFSSGEFKAEMASTSEYQELLSQLGVALAILELPGNTKPFRFTSKEAFGEKLKMSESNLRELELEEIENLWRWFSPANEWDNFTGIEGADLGARIFDLVDALRTRIG
jgi:hypothetical protein